MKVQARNFRVSDGPNLSRIIQMLAFFLNKFK